LSGVLLSDWTLTETLELTGMNGEISSIYIHQTIFKTCLTFGWIAR